MNRRFRMENRSLPEARHVVGLDRGQGRRSIRRRIVNDNNDLGRFSHDGRIGTLGVAPLAIGVDNGQPVGKARCHRLGPK